MIPDFEDGVLPEGIHECTMEETAERFGRFQLSDRRPLLTETLKRYIRELRSLDIASAVIIDGSYVTIKAEPNDIDLIVILKPGFETREELRPAVYNAQSRRMAQKHYGFDITSTVEGSRTYAQFLELFSGLRDDDPELRSKRTRKGILRINL